LFRFAYNTNGLAHHRVADALPMLAELGYEGVALTPDVGQLDPYHLDPSEVRDTRDAADELGLELAIETGARFLLDPRKKHRPTLLERDAAAREIRVDFLVRSVDLAVELGAEVVSLWSGAVPEDQEQGADGDGHAWDALCSGLVSVVGYAREREIKVAFEPEPGMFVERPIQYLELCRRMGADGDELGLCLDVGHLLVTGDLPVGKVVRELAPKLVHVHLDDIADGVHEHRMFGTGDLDLKDTLSALLEVGYAGMAAVELSRDSHRGAAAAAEAISLLRQGLP
jgi:sugar phosphate isomerase/epimerase